MKKQHISQKSPFGRGRYQTQKLLQTLKLNHIGGIVNSKNIIDFDFLCYRIMEIMLSRKLICKSENSKIDEFIHQLQQTHTNLSHPIFETILNSQSVTPYFHKLSELINSKNLILAKRYDVLAQGLYILLKGQISFMFCDQLADREREMNETRYTLTNKTARASVRSLLSKPLTIFQSTLNNCTSLENSHLLKINEQQATASKFYEFFNKRKELYENHYLPYDLQFKYNTDLINNIFTVDLRIHSNFYFKIYSLREIIVPNTVSIVSKGRAKLKNSNHASPQFEQYGILLPNISYEATSSELQIMVIQNNQTLKYKINTDQQICWSSPSKLSSHKSVSSSIHNRNFHPRLQLKHNENAYSKNDWLKRQKQLIRITRQTESYSIISSFLCQKSLDFAKEQNTKHHSREKKDTKCKNPLILFNITNSKSKLLMPNFTNKSNTTPNTLYKQRIKLCKTAPENIDNFKRIRKDTSEEVRLFAGHQIKDLATSPIREQNKIKTMFIMRLRKKISDFNVNQDQRTLGTIRQD